MVEKTSYYVTLPNATIAQLLLKYLQLEGVTMLFGIPGGALKNLLNELKTQRDTFSYIVCRHETGAAYIADGYARVSGKLGVVIVTSGPGATNALTGTMNAHNSYSALLTITGEVPEMYFGRGYLQEGIDANLDVDAIYRDATQYSAVISSPSNFQTLFAAALRAALSMPHRAAHISLPDDVAGTPLSMVPFPNSPQNYRATPDGANPAKVQQAFQLLLAAQRPLIFLGNGCRAVLQGDRLDRFIMFVEKFAIPVMTTPDAKGVFPESHPLALRNYALAACSWPALYMNQALAPHYDGLMVLGSELGGLATNIWNPLLIPDGPIIQVDLNQSAIARSFPVALGIVAEIGAVIDTLAELSAGAQPDQPVIEGRQTFIAQLKRDHSPFADPSKRDSSATPILPEALMKCIGEALPVGAQIFSDSANCVGWTLNYLTIDPPTQIHYSLSMGPMGYGVAGVIGGKLAAPDKTCLAVVGDGAFLMHGSEISTAAQHGVGAIWVVLYDNDLAMVSQGMNHFFSDPSVWKDYYSIGHADLAKFAESLGADTFTVYSVRDMRQALPDAIKNADDRQKPQVLIVHINTDEVPPYYPA
jgi:acetolactate synthase-1/2/3 large subunit